MMVSAGYFDGKTSRRHQVMLAVENGVARISGEAERTCPLSSLRVSETTRHAARTVTFPDGAYIEIDDDSAFRALLASTGHADALVVRLQQSWRGALLAILALAITLFLGWRYLLPQMAKSLAAMVPARMERTIALETLDFLDRRLMKPSTLPEAQQEAITARFARLIPAAGDAPRPRLLFRASRIGPNALALPAGQIVLTDELVEKLGQDEQALMAVLAHEYGHLQRRHLMRRMIQGAATSAAMLVLLGDASGMLATLPTLLLDLKHSRDAEREADDDAAELLKRNGIPAHKLADALETLTANSPESHSYLSSHPSNAERIARLRGASRVTDSGS
jgi:Zn-dependent protease with chaperone function